MTWIEPIQLNSSKQQESVCPEAVCNCVFLLICVAVVISMIVIVVWSRISLAMHSVSDEHTVYWMQLHSSIPGVSRTVYLICLCYFVRACCWPNAILFFCLSLAMHSVCHMSVLFCMRLNKHTVDRMHFFWAVQHWPLSLYTCVFCTLLLFTPAVF